ncbi:MAG: hypothetical protein MUC95_04805 [Spirochaetes bacterium]|jgi:hypothetical protein|nr:hypothetical protein [Spirochaetota bacterium]
MKTTGIIKISAALFIAFALTVNAYPISPIMKAEADYKFLLGHLRTLSVVIENFGNPENKVEFDETKALFQGATEEFYAQNFISSYAKYFKVKENLISLLDKVAILYIDRSKEILDSTSRQSFDLFIKYAKDNALAHYFTKPYNPVEDIKGYNPDEYHFFHDNETIESYLKNGYKNLEIAKKIYNDPDLLLLKEKEKKTAQNLNFIINRNLEVILYCRMAKLYSLEIHKIMKINRLGDILNKYRLTAGKLDPICDDRIPEEYKVDASDNAELIHSIEQQRLENNLQREKKGK